MSGRISGFALAAFAVCAATSTTLASAQGLPQGLVSQTGKWVLSADPVTEEHVSLYLAKCIKAAEGDKRGSVEECYKTAVPAIGKEHIGTLIKGGIVLGSSHSEVVHLYRNNGHTVYKVFSNGGSVSTIHYKDGKQYKYSNTNPAVFEQFNVCELAGAELSDSSDREKPTAGKLTCAQANEYFGELVKDSFDLVQAQDCQITVTDPELAAQLGCPNPPIMEFLDLENDVQFQGGDANGNQVWTLPAPVAVAPVSAGDAKGEVKGDRESPAAPQTAATEITYVESKEGVPLQFGDYFVIDFQSVLDDLSVFDVDPNCDLWEVTCPGGEVVFSPPPTAPAPTVPPPNCSAPAYTWSPTAEELDDSNCHADGFKWNNLTPPTRLWGTLWCGYGNEFSTIARWKKHVVSSSPGINKKNRSGEDEEYIKWGCGAEQVKDNKNWATWTDGIHPVGEVMFGHYYPRNNQGIQLQTGPGNNRKNTFNYINQHYVPTGISSYGIATDGINLLGSGVNYYNWDSVALTAAQTRLTRCRAMPNYIDQAFKNFNSVNNYNDGLHSQISESAFGEFTGLNWSPLIDIAFGTLSDDWCRRHDFCPVGQGETKQTCACDGAAEQATIEIDNAGFNPFIDIGKILFHDHQPAQGCWNLELKCNNYHQPMACAWGICIPTGFPYCNDFRVIWNRKEINKYNPSNDEGKKLWGPVAANTYGQSSLCLSLRLPGEGVDGYGTEPKIGDGVCDCQFNNDLWGYDGGDCCASTCKGSCNPAQLDCKQPGCKKANGQTVGPWPAINARISGNDGLY
jgi:hypothetical protein